MWIIWLLFVTEMEVAQDMGGNGSAGDDRKDEPNENSTLM